MARSVQKSLEELTKVEKSWEEVKRVEKNREDSRHYRNSYTQNFPGTPIWTHLPSGNFRRPPCAGLYRSRDLVNSCEKGSLHGDFASSLKGSLSFFQGSVYIYIQILWVLLRRPCKDLANFKGSLYRELVNSECPCLEILWVLLKSPCKEILQFDWKGLCKEILRGPGNVLVSMWRSCEFFWKGFLQRDLASSLNRSFQIDLVFFFERALAKRSCKFLEQVLVNRSCECSWSLSRDLASSLQVSLYTDLVSSSKGPCIDVEILWTLLRRVLVKRSCKFLERALPRKSCVFLLMVLAKRSCYLIERVLVGRFELLSKTAV